MSINVRVLLSVLLSGLLWELPRDAGAASKKGKPLFAGKRELKRRTLTITDSNVNTVQEIHVAGGVPTTLVFQVPIKEKAVVLADVTDSFVPPQTTETSILLVAKSDLPHGARTTLTVTLTDGTVLPFILATLAAEADVQVDIDVALEKRAGPESVPALKAAINQLRGKLDECEASSGTAGIAKLVALILSQDIDKPQVFERHNVHKGDKQSRLLVRVQQAYRLFDETYLVLTVDNRDPSRPWVLDHPEIGIVGDKQMTEVKVSTFATELSTLAPDESEKIVVAFSTPSQTVNQRFYVALFEKNGNRHVRLEGFNL